MKYCLLPLPLLLLAACAGGGSSGRFADSPFAQIYAEYTIPVALGKALPGKVGGWDESITLKGWVQGLTHAPAAHDVDDTFVNYVLHPLSGSETHMMTRKRGWSFTESFLFD